MIAVLDSCVLFPAPLRDLLMHLTLAGAFQARWTDRIHDEWTRNVLKNRPDLTFARLQRTRQLMDEYADNCLVERYERHIDGLVLPDPDDRHVLAAAIQCKAQAIVTFNLRDFPRNLLDQHGLRAVGPDDFVTRLFEKDPGSVCLAFSRQLASLKNPPITKQGLMQILTKQGLVETVVLLKNCPNEFV